MLEYRLEPLGVDATDHQKCIAGNPVARACLKSFNIDVVKLEVPTNCGKRTLLIWSDDFDDRSITGALDGHGDGVERAESWPGRGAGCTHALQPFSQRVPRSAVELHPARNDERMKREPFASPC